MRILSALILMAALFGGCTKVALPKEIADSNIVEYPAQDDQHTLVIIQDNISDSKARKMALKRAAEITVNQGDRYFVILSEQKVQVVKPAAPRMPGNLYQELIIQDNFGQQSLGQDVGPNGALYPGLRIVFQCYEEKPQGKASINACDYTSCK